MSLAGNRARAMIENAAKATRTLEDPVLRWENRGKSEIWFDRIAAFGLAIVYLGLLLRTAGDLGYSRDEGFYFHAARAYQGWFKGLFTSYEATTSRAGVEAVWAVNSEHPSLMKSLFALSNLFFHQKLRIFQESGTSFRFPAMVLSGVLVGTVYLWGARILGRAPGFIAALLLALMPRFFYHAHLACFDAPIVAMFFFCMFGWGKSLEKEGWRWPLLTALFFGLALDTKHNSWFLPILAGAHTAVLVVWSKIVKAPTHFAARQTITTLLFMAILGPLVCYALWPWLWHEPVQKFRGYALFHLEHEYYNMELFGETYWKPPMPRTYAPMMTLATVPTVTLLLAGLGAFFALFRAVRGLRERDSSSLFTQRTPVLWVMAVLVCYGPWVSSNTPIFGGTKHWMTAYPFLCLLAGLGVKEVIAEVQTRLEDRFDMLVNGGRAAIGVVSLSVLTAPLLETAHSHPWGLSAYVPLVGGARGGANLGLNRSFWGYTTGSIVEYLNREVPSFGRVYMHDTAWPSWEMLREDGRLRKDIVGVGAAHEADFAIYHHEMHMAAQEYQAWVLYGTVAPDHIAGIDGVPVVWVYRRKVPSTASPQR